MDARARVLVVDDEEVVRRSYAAVLDDAKCDARAVADGDAALAAMQALPFDVVLLDLRMPGRDGLAVLEEMKREWPEAEVVVITGYPEVETAKRALRAGACDYIGKPVGPGEIVAATFGALRRKRWALRGSTDPITRSFV